MQIGVIVKRLNGQFTRAVGAEVGSGTVIGHVWVLESENGVTLRSRSRLYQAYGWTTALDNNLNSDDYWINDNDNACNNAS
ncbi:hypothetical protein CIB48_g2887 [Xylaria polymorpha]|nr:hypothetical protein CIB48_g2887 [Xylaria polymorpha]